MIRVLHVIGAMDRAGAESMIMNYYRAIDRDRIQFDFLVHTDRHCDFDDEIEALGGRIHRLPRFTGLNYFQYKNACKRFFATHPEIDIVHGHIESCASIYLPAAREQGLMTICHSHQAKGPLSPFEIAFRLATVRNKHSADLYMACSQKAGIDRFGSTVVESDRFSVLNNAIDLTTFDSTEEQRLHMKETLGVSKRPVFGHVGRFTEAKNHLFLIDVFAKIVDEVPDAQLLLVGRGEQEKMIRDIIGKKGLSDSVQFLGIRDDIPQVMAAMDVFLLPSLWEGLPVVAIEAQASGLPSLISSNISSEAAILPSTEMLPITNADLWASEAIARLEIERMNKGQIEQALVSHGYEITSAAEKLSNFYLNLKK